jgi:site-specific DNA recombinase
MRTAIYIRVSTEEQAKEGFSIAAQKERLTAYTYSQEWEIIDYYIDEGYSAKDTNRPQLQRLIKAVRDKKIDVVLVHKLDRFTRSVKDLYNLLDEFDQFKCGFRSAQEQFDTTTSMGRAMMGMLGIFAQWERESIAARVYVGMEQKHLSGKRNGAIAPLGYDKEGDQLILNQDAALVRKIFELYQDNQGVLTVTKHLNKQGHNFNYRTLHYILTNPVYCGRLRWNYRKGGVITGNEIIVEGNQEPIVSAEEFDHVQRILSYRKNKGKAATSQYPFTKLMKCARCGGAMVGASRMLKDRRYKFYRCSSRINKGTCDMPQISEVAVTNHFLREINLNKKDLQKLFKNVTITLDEKTELKDLQKELSAIEKRKKKFQFAFANDAITLEELKSNTQQDKEREKEIKEKLVQLPKEETQWDKNEVLDIIKNLSKHWGSIENEVSKKEILNEIIDTITIDALETPRKHYVDDVKLNLTVEFKHL